MRNHWRHGKGNQTNQAQHFATGVGRVCPVQVATDDLLAYPFHIRQHVDYEVYLYDTETKIFGEPQLPDGTLARLGRNEGVRKMVTAEREAVVRLAGLRKPHHKPY